MTRADLEMAAQAGARSVYCGQGMALCRMLGRHNIYVRADDISVASHLMLHGIWEPWVTVAISNMVRPGWRCVDVGALYGYYTLLMSGLGADVVAVEPNPRAAKMIALSLAQNGLNGNVYPVAVGRQEKPIELGVPEHFWGGSAVRRSPTQVKLDNVISYSCPQKRLDDLVGGKIDFIKIDAEGMDYEVIAGAEGLINVNPEIKILFEHADGFYHDGDAGLDMVIDMGFCLFAVDYNGMLLSVSKEDVKKEQGRCWNLLASR